MPMLISQSDYNELLRAVASRISDEIDEGNTDPEDIARKVVEIPVTNVLGLQIIDPPDPNAKFAVWAEVHTDDRVYEVVFDAVKWFEKATDEQILSLATEGWGCDATSDEIPLGSGPNPDIQALFDYLGHKNKGGTELGYGCTVDEMDARNWIKVNRKLLWSTMVRDGLD